MLSIYEVVNIGLLHVIAPTEEVVLLLGIAKGKMWTLCLTMQRQSIEL